MSFGSGSGPLPKPKTLGAFGAAAQVSQINQQLAGLIGGMQKITIETCSICGEEMCDHLRGEFLRDWTHRMLTWQVQAKTGHRPALVGLAGLKFIEQMELVEPDVDVKTVLTNMGTALAELLQGVSKAAFGQRIEFDPTLELLHRRANFGTFGANKQNTKTVTDLIRKTVNTAMATWEDEQIDNLIDRRPELLKALIEVNEWAAKTGIENVDQRMRKASER